GREVVGDAADGRRVGAAVVVDHDDDRAFLVRGDVVERLPAHPAGQRAVPDHRDGVAPGAAGQVEGLGQTVHIGQCGGGVAALHQVVLTLRTRRVTRDAAGLAEQVEAVRATGDDLVHVGLVADVPDDRVAR